MGWTRLPSCLSRLLAAWLRGNLAPGDSMRKKHYRFPLGVSLTNMCLCEDQTKKHGWHATASNGFAASEIIAGSCQLYSFFGFQTLVFQNLAPLKLDVFTRFINVDTKNLGKLEYFTNLKEGHLGKFTLGWGRWLRSLIIIYPEEWPPSAEIASCSISRADLGTAWPWKYGHPNQSTWILINPGKIGKCVKGMSEI